MSHLEERKEKICLNCGAELIDRYCQKCGQENVEPKENFLHLTRHFLEDVTHFDGKFFSTLKYLITKPGFLTEEYIRGRRASYINPIRLYLFISALFFLLLMSFLLPDSIRNEKTGSGESSKADSSIYIGNGNAYTGIGDTLSVDTAKGIVVTREGNNIHVRKTSKNNGQTVSYGTSDWLPEQTVAEYDSIQNALPKAKRDGWIKRYYKRKLIATRDLSHKDSKELLHRVKERFFHSMPYMLFLSLPLMALLLQLLYVRRKQFFYVSHIIFLLHFYCLVFVAMIISRSFALWGGTAGSVISGLIGFGYYVYLYVAMLRFYKQRWFKTLVKFLLFLFIGGFILLILGILFAVNSFLNSGGV